MQSGRPVRTEIQMAGYDGLDLGCDKAVAGLWLELGLLVFGLSNWMNVGTIY